MSDNPYEVMAPQGPFGKAVDKAIAEENARPYTDEDRAADEENAARWAALTAAQETAGAYGVVLPVATVAEILKVLRKEPSNFYDHDEPTSSLLERMLESDLAKAEALKGEQS